MESQSSVGKDGVGTLCEVCVNDGEDLEQRRTVIYIGERGDV
jgi:hypothetical protein